MIRILWIVNGLLPAVQRDLFGREPIDGSWLNEPLAMLARNREMEVHVVTLDSHAGGYAKELGGIFYHVLRGSYRDRFISPSKQYLKQCKTLVEVIRPDLLHIHGSEFAIGLGILPFVQTIPRLLSIQGLISVINRKYYYGGIHVGSWLRCAMPDRLLTLLPMKVQHARNRFRERTELMLFQGVQAVIGCTRWDNAHSNHINQDLNYYPLAYAIRHEFDDHAWDRMRADSHTILMGSMMVPLKGFHMALEAVRLLKSRYSDIKLRVAGYDSVHKRFPIGYPRYLKNLIRKWDLQDVVQPLGPLDAVGMAKAMQKAHVFVLSSCIENGPNTLLEAMRVGTPCVCSYVGGAMDLAKPDEDALFYRFEEPVMLAHQIERVWENGNLADQLSQSGKAAARRHGTYTEVYSGLLKIYADILGHAQER